MGNSDASGERKHDASTRCGERDALHRDSSFFQPGSLEAERLRELAIRVRADLGHVVHGEDAERKDEALVTSLVLARALWFAISAVTFGAVSQARGRNVRARCLSVWSIASQRVATATEKIAGHALDLHCCMVGG